MKPCPFCASTRLDKTTTGTWSRRFVTCLDCGATGPRKDDGDPYGMMPHTSGAREAPAVNAWNQRKRVKK